MNSSPERLPYSHDQFVNRQAEIELVLNQVRRLLDGEPLERRTVIFHGQRGSGKSWLLKEMAYLLENEQGKADLQNDELGQLLQEIARLLKSGRKLFPLYLDLDDCADQAPDAAVRDVIERIHLPVADSIGPVATGFHAVADLDRMSAGLITDVKQIGGVLVLLLDHVDESDTTFLELLEDHLLASLINVPCVLLVLAGRGKEYLWKSPSIRLKSKELDLGPFEEAHIQEQLQKQVDEPTPPVDQVKQLGSGFPWNNYLLAKDPDDRITALESCLAALIGDLLERVEPPLDRAYLEALCVLRAFGDEMIPPMLAAYFNDPAYRDWSYRQYSQVRRSLVGTTLAKWDGPSGGYVLDEALCRVLEHWLYLSAQALWTRLHEAARDMFDEWVEDYARSKSQWQKRARDHRGWLKHGPAWPPEGEEEETE